MRFGAFAAFEALHNDSSLCLETNAKPVFWYRRKLIANVSEGFASGVSELKDASGQTTAIVLIHLIWRGNTLV